MTKEALIKKYFQTEDDYRYDNVCLVIDEARSGLINVLRLIEVELLDIGLKKPLRAFYSIDNSLKLIRAALEQIDNKQTQQS